MLYGGNSHIGGLCRGPIIRGTRYGTRAGREGEGAGGRIGTFCVLRPLLTHVQLHNSIVVSIRAPFSPGLSPLHPFGEGQRDGSEKFALTSFLKLDFGGERGGKGDFDVKRAPWNKHLRAYVSTRVCVCTSTGILFVLHIACVRIVDELDAKNRYTRGDAISS